MDEQLNGPTVTNWFGDIHSQPRVVVKPSSVEEIVEVLKNRDKYPSPVRAVGSNHSVTRCTVAEGGTLIDMTGLNRIVQIGTDIVTAQGGALYIDVSKELDKHHLQFYVNIELGNLSVGAGACCATKDGSFPGGFGQVSAYVTAMKVITPAGELIEVSEAKDPGLMQAMRSSYGLLGIVYEATFKVKPVKPMIVQNITYTVDTFLKSLPTLVERGDCMMFYMSPSLEKITVEFTRFAEESGGAPSRWEWKLRNEVWKNIGPSFSYLCTHYVANPKLRSFLIDTSHGLQQWGLMNVVKSQNTVASDAAIRYPDRPGIGKYTFSIWCFLEESYGPILRAYVEFCRDYYKRTGYRNDVLDVGYRCAQDTNSLLSYAYDGTVLTIDPVCTGAEGWEDFVVAYNEFCSQHGGFPLFNQTPLLTREQVKKAFGARLEKFIEYRKRFDPTDRLLNPYFKELLGENAPDG
jgi:FAD/FMN-containing dehydrogenase